MMFGVCPIQSNQPITRKSKHTKTDWRHLLRRLKRRAGDDSSYDSEDDDEEGYGPRGPPSIISSLQASVHDLQASVHSFLHTVEDRFHRV
jgi:hypothetical protein